ncbi:SidA/IucD/PvdA family monooxygenase [Pendulispora rubella]|uniref:SidA/IucD/PvdA family monooxygenase n=1 Tax=Pendulispora rubella TaxID=2741070 RepID=A0ABZ2L4Q1_9BACT
MNPNNPENDFDVIAIGCGPFNLGLAALASTVDGVKLTVLEAQADLRWHSGMMFDDAMLQVNFMADLVTLVEPSHPLSFLAHLRDTDRLYPFYIRQQFHSTRKEYEHYLRWAAAKLSSIRFSHHVDKAAWDPESERFVVHAVREGGERVVFRTRHLVLGVGTEPSLPPSLRHLPKDKLLHTADFLRREADMARAKRVTVVGSGQSGAEAALDLLRKNLTGGPAVSWLTRTISFAPLDYTKLVLEMTTPAYVGYFHSLPQAKRDELLAEQWRHYKGISTATLELIHDALYRREFETGLADVELRCGISIEASSVADDGQVVLTCRQRDTDRLFEHRTDMVVAATGYTPRRPAFLEPLESVIRRDAKKRYIVGLDHAVELAPSVTGRIFVANADLHSHGAAAPDLGIGAYRNATILNAIAGRPLYRLPKHTAYTTFEP